MKIEFYDEDFPFRYTPASPANGSKHLRPWLALFVLKENEFLEEVFKRTFGDWSDKDWNRIEQMFFKSIG